MSRSQALVVLSVGGSGLVIGFLALIPSDVLLVGYLGNFARFVIASYVDLLVTTVVASAGIGLSGYTFRKRWIAVFLGLGILLATAIVEFLFWKTVIALGVTSWPIHLPWWARVLLGALSVWITGGLVYAGIQIKGRFTG